jgi:acyl carrier protein
MQTEQRIRDILRHIFGRPFVDSNEELIYNHLDSVRHFRFLLALEEEFKVDLGSSDVSTISKAIKAINEADSI